MKSETRNPQSERTPKPESRRDGDNSLPFNESPRRFKLALTLAEHYFGFRASALLLAGVFSVFCLVARAAAPAGATANRVPTLTLEQAHEIALQNHPQIRAADLRAMVARQVTIEVRAGLLPNVSANVMAVGTGDENTRLAAIGALNNPAIFERTAEGVILSQLITDFGRSLNLTGNARLQAEAAANNAMATREQILLAVDGAFYAVLQAQAVTRVAQETVTNRQVFLDQVSVLASNQLRSELDVTFARVNLQDAELLLVKAQNDLQAALAQLADLLALREPQFFQLVEQPMPAEVSSNVFDFVQQGLRLRPELLALRNQREGALKYARAQKEARYPSIAAVAGGGLVQFRDPALPDRYAAAGLSLSLPLFAGGYYSARQQEAELQAEAEDEDLRNLENNVIRDVRIAWLNTQNARERYRLTVQMLETVRQSYTLALARYKNGLSSIVEFDQAELNLISTEISLANTRYEYLLQRSALSFQTGTLR
jgi:outer membrane protein